LLCAKQRRTPARDGEAETSHDNFLRGFGERFVPGYNAVSTLDLLMNAPFAE
jgi:hypothetical protein